MTATASPTVHRLVSIALRAASTPITPLERLEVALERSLAVARDTTRTEQDRLKELRQRIELMHT